MMLRQVSPAIPRTEPSTVDGTAVVTSMLERRYQLAVLALARYHSDVNVRGAIYYDWHSSRNHLADLKDNITIGATHYERRCSTAHVQRTTVHA